MLNYLRLRRRLRMNSTKKWFDDLNDISGWHLHDGEVDALAILADEVRRQYVVPEAINAALQGSQLLTDHLRMTKLTYVKVFSLKGRMATSCARCDVTVSTRPIAESQC